MPARVILHALLGALVLAVTGSPAHADGAEDRLVEWIAVHENRALEVLEETVNVNSGTGNFDGVRRVGELFAAEFESLGFETEWVDGASFDRAGHLVARRSGAGGGDRPSVLLIGHLDTVFEADSPFQRYEQLDAERARGPGVTDMKGGNVVMLFALGALDAIGRLDAIDVTAVLTGDEERAGRPLAAARKALVDAAREADFAIGFEDGDGNPKTAVISRRGSGGWRLDVTARPAHSSQIFQPEVGSGAIYEVARILGGFREALAGEENLTFNPGVVLGGTRVEFDQAEARGTAFGKNNVIAESALVTGDLRAISPEQYERATAAMRRVVEASPPHADAEITFSPSYPPMAPSAGNQRLLALYDAVSRDLGHGPVAAVDPRNAGAADISFAAEFVEMALDGIGLMGTGGHTLDETADLETLRVQVERAAVLLLRLATGVEREARADS